MTICDMMGFFLTFYALFYFVWLCMIVYNTLLHRMTTDYVWLCKTLTDTVWLCMTLYDSDWMNQFHKHWPFSNGPNDVSRWQRGTFFLLFFFFFFLLWWPLLDWLRQIMLYFHWSTQNWCSSNAHVPATDEAVLCTLIEPRNAGA